MSLHKKNANYFNSYSLQMNVSPAYFVPIESKNWFRPNPGSHKNHVPTNKKKKNMNLSAQIH